MTAVRPPSRFGELLLDEGVVRSFVEKPQTGAGWINGGFFVFDTAAVRALPDREDLSLESHVLEKLAAEGQLSRLQARRFLAMHGHLSRDANSQRHVGERYRALENNVTTASPGTGVVDRDFWRNRRVLVTGHTGFIGGWASAWLCALGSEVSGISLPPPTDPSFHDLVGLQGRVNGVIADVRSRRRIWLAHLKRQSLTSFCIWRHSPWFVSVTSSPTRPSPSI